MKTKEEYEKLCAIISNVVREVVGRELDAGGGRTFYTPEEWREREEEYGLDSLLIVVHDGGDYAEFFNYSYLCPESIAAMETALSVAGYYIEPCTCWYSAVYKINP